MGTAGIVSAGAVYVPLDRRVALVMGDVETQDLRVAGTTSWWQTLNHEMAYNARRCVFHHPGDDISDVKLPQPRDHEMVDLLEQVRRFIPVEDRDPEDADAPPSQQG